MLDAEIIYLTPVSVLQKINKIWDDVDGCWEETNAQSARKKFYDKYASSSKNDVRDLLNAISV